MDRLISLGVFEDAVHAVMASDAAGRVRLCNKAAAALLGCDRCTVLDRPCWEVARFETLSGGAFCSRDCPIQREGRTRNLSPSHQVRVRANDGPPVHVDLVSLLVPPSERGRSGVLHLIRPLPAPRAAAGDVHAGSRPGEAPRQLSRLSRLSRREMEILRLLADGLDTDTIAARLRISRVTVRSHVQSILGKLGVHRRLQAVLALLRPSR